MTGVLDTWRWRPAQRFGGRPEVRSRTAEACLKELLGMTPLQSAGACQLLLPPEHDLSEEQKGLLRNGTRELRRWRHFCAT